MALDVTCNGGEIPHLAVWVAAPPSTQLSAALCALRTQRREPGRYPPPPQAVVQALACYPTGASRLHCRATLIQSAPCGLAMWLRHIGWSPARATIASGKAAGSVWEESKCQNRIHACFQTIFTPTLGLSAKCAMRRAITYGNIGYVSKGRSRSNGSETKSIRLGVALHR